MIMKIHGQSLIIQGQSVKAGICRMKLYEFRIIFLRLSSY